jgi:hypothetical protein
MKIQSIISGLLIFFVIANCVAQTELSQNDIDSLYIKALSERLDWQLSSGYKYVDVNEKSKFPKAIFESGMIKIRTQNELIDISRKERKELTIYTLDVAIISSDTVDINFGEYQLKSLKPKSKKGPFAEISECKCASKPYIPDIRFVYIDNRWKIIKSKFINR